MAKTRFHFAGGPSKDDLKLALFNGNQLKEQAVFFGGKNPVYISSVEREDNSYDSWNITGKLYGEKVTIHYRTDKRTGTVTYL